MSRRNYRAGRLRAPALALLLLLSPFATSLARAADGDPATPPYEASLVRLSEILGALHYLRPLCGADEPTLWRDQMEALMTAENPAPERRARIVTAFNHGYSSYAALYRSCTPAAVAVVGRYMDEGEKLTDEITTRYGR